ncbi:MAG: hypothetical protein WDN46_22100 [Methylocella sp.]
MIDRRHFVVYSRTAEADAHHAAAFEPLEMASAHDDGVLPARPAAVGT